MAQFDPTQRRETWLFQEMCRDVNTGEPVYRALQYVLVTYDGDPQQYLEPIPVDEVLKSNVADMTLSGNGYKPVDPRSEGLGRCTGFKFFTSRPFEPFALNDVDAANNLGQLAA
jgi:hypothetical protein